MGNSTKLLTSSQNLKMLLMISRGINFDGKISNIKVQKNRLLIPVLFFILSCVKITQKTMCLMGSN